MPESSHPYFLQADDVSDCGRPKYGETRPLSAKTNRKHSKIRLCADTYTLGEIHAEEYGYKQSTS